MWERLQQVPRGAADAAGVVALTVLLRLAYGPGAIGYDGSYAVLWGRSLARAELPRYEGPFAPTPHPLLNLVATPLSWWGDSAQDALVLLTLAGLAALGWFAFRLGSELFTPVAGAVLALVLLTRPALVNETLQGLVDIPFLALVVAAGVVALRHPGCQVVVLVLLGLAGLLRPEGWGLAALYAAAAWRAVPAGRRPALVAMALAAPVLWALSDLAVTGDPLHSLNGTRALADELERPRGLLSALETMPSGLQQLLEPAVAALGMAGALLGVLVLPERAGRVAAVGALGLVGFLVIGLAGLPVLTRYLLVPAVVVALFAAVALTGWRCLAPGAPGRRAWSFAAAAGAVVLVASFVPTARELADLREFVAARRAVQLELREVARTGPAGDAIARCRPLHAPEYQPVPLLALWLDRPPAAFPVGGAIEDGAAITYASPVVAQVLSILPRRPPPPLEVGPDTTEAHRGDAWVVLAGC